MKPYFKPRTNSAKSYKVTELCKIYEYPPPSSNPVTVAIPSWGGGVYGTITNEILTNGDVQKCWAYEGILPDNMPIVKVKFIGGATNNLSERVYNMTCENALDIISVGSCCPTNKLTIILFIFPYDWSFTQGLVTVLKSPATIISCSWGSPEIRTNMEDMVTANAMLQKATSRGINMCAASGDNGADDGTHKLALDYPSACPYVISVGGTTLTDLNGVWSRETVWNSPQGSTGGGVSNYFLKQSWQTKQTRPGKFRSSPDIALVADPNTGITIVLNGNLVYGIGGTSVSAPMFAGFLACISPAVNVSPLLYSAPSSCYRDITVGNNDGYNAGPGYDYCTGLGSIIGTKLANYISLKNFPSVLATKITLSLADVLKVNKPVKLLTTLSPFNVTNPVVRFTSSNPNFIIKGGYLICKKPGTATIVAFTMDGSKQMSKLIVTVKYTAKMLFK
jgi:kumamolisin